MSEAPESPKSVFGDIVASVLDVVAKYANEGRATPVDAVKSLLRQEAACVAQAHSGRVVDAPSEGWVMLCAHFLAAYRMLRGIADDDAQAVAILAEAARLPFAQQIPAYLASRFGITQDAPEEAFDRVAHNFKIRGEMRFGATFNYMQAVQDPDRSHIHITRCFFADFFVANGAPAVTPVLCALDMVWAEELAHPRYGVRFERPTTLAAGDDACRFQFTRI